MLISIGCSNGTIQVSENSINNIEHGKSALENEDYSLARKLLLPLADDGNLEAQYLLGKVMLYSSTNDSEENDAFVYLYHVRDKSREQAKLNDINAQYRLVHMYSHTSQLLLETDEAKHWAEEAAQQGHVAAAYELSRLIQGAESYRWLKYAADHGYSEAQWRLGNLYVFGDADTGIEQNKRSAFTYYKLAAENGFDMAFYDYAIDLVTGDGGHQDLQEGEKWMKKAAESGSIAAIKFFINTYTNGYCGIKPDSQKAAYWQHRLEQGN